MCEERTPTAINLLKRLRPQAREGSPDSGFPAGNLMRLIAVPTADESVFDSMLSLAIGIGEYCTQCRVDKH